LGLANVELGLKIARELARYIGIAWERRDRRSSLVLMVSSRNGAQT